MFKSVFLYLFIFFGRDFSVAWHASDHRERSGTTNHFPCFVCVTYYYAFFQCLRIRFQSDIYSGRDYFYFLSAISYEREYQCCPFTYMYGIRAIRSGGSSVPSSVYHYRAAYYRFSTFGICYNAFHSERLCIGCTP